jgi:hypothetical protein
MTTARFEYSIVTNLTDGRQLTGSGYTTMADVLKHVNERRVYNRAELRNILVIRSDGDIVRFELDSKYDSPADRKRWQYWYADAKAAAGEPTNGR